MNVRANPHHDGSPGDWVVRHAHLIAPDARVLDVAAGRGRHARFLAARGCRVTAVDRDAGALAEARDVPGVTVQVADLEAGAWPFAAAAFDAIVVVHYLHRPLLPALVASLAPAGVLLYETFARGNEAFGRPHNADFLLEPGELLAAIEGRLTPVAFEQGLVQRGDRAAVVQRLAAVGPAYPWPPALGPRPG